MDRLVERAIWLLRPAFSRLRAFLWFATAVAGFHGAHGTAGRNQPGARAEAQRLASTTSSSITFTSPAVKLDRLAALWTQVVLRLFPQPLRINGRCGPWSATASRVPKRGRKMPAVKLLQISSPSRTPSPEYITGHSLQAVSLLVQAAASVFAVPLAMRIHEGLIWSNRDRRTLLDKMLAPLGDRRHRRTSSSLRRRRLLCRAQDRLLHRPAQRE